MKFGVEHWLILALLGFALVLGASRFAKRKRPKISNMDLAASQVASVVAPIHPAESGDFSNRAFGLRVVAIVCSYMVLFMLVKGNFFVALGATIGTVGFTALLFLVLWTGIHLGGRKLDTPRQMAFELGVCLFVLFVIFQIVELRIAQVTR